jgi:hypothetical protein
MAIDFFGAGVLYAIPQFTAEGVAIATNVQSPVQFGIVQDVTIDDEAEVKELFGANAYPVDIGRGKSKITIKCKQAQFSAQLFNTIYFGQSLTAGYNAIYSDTTGTVVPGTAGATSVLINPVDPTGGTSVFVQDLGVQDGNGVPYTRVASAPTGGQYTLTATAGGSTATYLFGDQAVGSTVFISYQYSNSTNPSTGKIMNVYNIPMGQVPVFAAQFFNSRRGQSIWRRFPACVATKLSMDFKNDDFSIPDFEISCFADANNIVQQYSFSI